MSKDVLNIWVNNMSFLYGRFLFQTLLLCPGVDEVVGCYLSLPLSYYFSSAFFFAQIFLGLVGVFASPNSVAVS